MPEAVCVGGAMSCAELAAIVQARMVIAGTVASLVCVVLGMAFVRFSA